MTTEAPEQRELTDEEKAQLQNTGLWFHRAAKNPGIRRKLLGIVKEVEPEQVIPELDLSNDIDARIEARVKPVLEENERLVKKIETLESRDGRRSFMEEHNLDDAELVDVETTAKEYGISNGAKAVEFWRERQQLGVPRSTPVNNGDAEYVAQVQKHAGDPRKLKELATAQATKVLREVRGGRVRR